MNLNAVVGPVIAAINPNLLVSVRQSIGQAPTAASGSRAPQYAEPGEITGSIGDGTSGPGTLLTVSAVAQGGVLPGQTLAGAGILAGTLITSQVSGKPLGAGIYQVNQPQQVASESISLSTSLYGQVQPITWRDLQQLEGLNIGGVRKALYYNGDLNAVVRVRLKGGDLITLPDGSVWLVALQLEGWSISAGWSKVAMVLQDGS